MTATGHSLPELLAMMQKQSDNVELALYLGARLEEAGNFEQAAALWSLGDDIGGLVRHARNDPNAAKQMRADSERADQGLRRFLTGLHEASVDDFERETGDEAQRIRQGIWSLTHDEEFEFKHPLQRPVIFYIPDLPQKSVWSAKELERLSPLIDGFADIAAEYSTNAQDLNLVEPYVPKGTPGGEWRKLRGKLDWSALYLFKDSQPTEHVSHFPGTLEFFKKLDLVRINGNPMEIFFSRLTPGAHIPPHFGLTNSRLTVHLPLIVPDNCAIRIAGKEHHWREGEPLAFDDSFEHEAWNKSGADRVVLIFEIHHPDLLPAECKAIEHCYAARDKWLQSRRHILGWE
ncbi:MAG: aspartyl/asparaginyl beta-hydroxylase domain-containing protein [Sphingorhabdus sp.]